MMPSAAGYLTVDVGSSGVRVTLFDAHLAAVARAARPFPMRAATRAPGGSGVIPSRSEESRALASARGHTTTCGSLVPRDDTISARGSSQAELNVDQLWAAVGAAIREVTSAGPAIAAVGVTAQLGIVVCDGAGQALRPALLWADQRAAAEAAEIAAAYGEDSLYRVTGRRVDAELPAPKLLWLKRHEPDLWPRVRIALSLKDHLVHRFTGAAVTDPAHASYSLLFDVGAGCWDEAIVQELGLAAVAVPVRPGCAIAGGVTPAAAHLTGIAAGTPVIVGGPDGSAGAIGAGLTAPGTAVDISGTTDVFFTAVDRPIRDPARRVVLNASLLPGLWSLGGPMGMTGGMLRWFATELAAEERAAAARRGDSVYALLDELAAAAPAGSGGVVALPAMTGERAPTWDHLRRGALIGLTPEHGRGHLARAILEGGAFALRELIDAVAALGAPVGEVRLAGGGAQSALWTQIRADVCERPFAVVRERAASSLGTAMLAAVAVGRFASVAEAARDVVVVDRVVLPSPAEVAVYRRLWPVARGMAAHLAADFVALHDALQLQGASRREGS